MFNIFKELTEIKTRIKQLECNHENVEYYTPMRILTAFTTYYKKCNDCGLVSIISKKEYFIKSLEKEYRTLDSLKKSEKDVMRTIREYKKILKRKINNE